MNTGGREPRSVGPMPLLSRMMRTAAITGSPEMVSTELADRQGSAWARQWIRGVYPAMTHQPSADRDQRLRALTDLYDRGAITNAEYDALRVRLQI
jgi:hypothetical protein